MKQAVSSAAVNVHVLQETGWDKKPLDEAAISALLDDRSQLAWIDIEGDPSQIEACLQTFLTDCHGLKGVGARRATEGGEDPPRRPPKAKAFANAIFTRAYWMGTDASIDGTGRGPVRAQEIHVLAGHSFAITMRYPRQGWSIDGTALGPVTGAGPHDGFRLDLLTRDVTDLRDRIGRRSGEEAFGLEVAAAVLDQVVDSVFDVLNELRQRVDRLEADVVRGDWLDQQGKGSGPNLPERTLGMRKLLRQIRWAFLPSDEISELLTGPFIDMEDKGLSFRLKDLAREADRAVEMVRDVLDQLQQTVELSSTMKADRLNDTIYLLTIIATVLLVPTLVAGIFGMNFVELPGTSSRVGFWISLLGMAILGVVVWFGIRGYLRLVYRRRVSEASSKARPTKKVAH